VEDQKDLFRYFKIDLTHSALIEM
ncbi:MAG: hypothetical protein H6R23_308, partial [Proteobacteria bacterium]|nr:hypothetical protein [Pseudomonadota bacterium]